MSQFLQPQGYARLFDRLAFFTTDFRVSFILSRFDRSTSSFGRSTSSGTKVFAPTLTHTRPRCTCSVGGPTSATNPLQYPRTTLLLQRRGTWSSSQSLLVTPVATIVRPVAWFLLVILLLILPPKTMMTMTLHAPMQTSCNTATSSIHYVPHKCVFKSFDMTLHCSTCVYKVTSPVSYTVEPCSDVKSPAKATLSMPICSISVYTNFLFTTSTMTS